MISPALLIDERTGQSAETALEPHVRAAAQAKQCFVDVSDLEVDLPPLAAPSVHMTQRRSPEVRDGVPVRDLVLHALHGLQ